MKSVLVINTTPRTDVVTVRIDDQEYPLRHPESFGFVEYHRLARLGTALDAVLVPRELTRDEETRASELLDVLCRMVLDAPDLVHCQLRDTARARIFSAWTESYPAALVDPRARADAAAAVALERAEGV